MDSVDNSGAYIQRAENGFIVEIVQIEEKMRDPQDFLIDGDPEGMAEHRAQTAPKKRVARTKVFVFEYLSEALGMIERYFEPNARFSKGVGSADLKGFSDG